MNPTRREAIRPVPVRTITAATTQGNYAPNWIPVRLGAQDHEQVPSRRSNKRYYRDGRVEAA